MKKKNYILIAIALLFVGTGTASAAIIPNPGIIHNGETFTVGNGDELSISGTLIIEEGGTLIADYVYLSGTLTNRGDTEIRFIDGGYCSIENYGTMNFTSDMMMSECNMTNYENGTMVICGWPISIPHDIVNYGYMTNGKGLQSISEFSIPSRFFNYGTFENRYGCYLDLHGTFINQGTLINNGYIDNFQIGIIENHGTFIHNGHISTHYYNEKFDSTGIINNYCGSAFVDNGTMRYTIVNDILCPGEEEIPEFPTIALPILAIIGLAFVFRRR